MSNQETAPNSSTAKRKSTKSANASKQGAHCWSQIKIESERLADEHGRTLLLRGVNLSGNSKIPMSPSKSNISGTEEFFDHRNVSFVGRPFNSAEAHEHFERISNWGLTFVRLLVPWEALEHSGPGIYDEDYIDSLIKLLAIAPKYGIKCFIDPHQDTWSRFSGGSGAPGWTMEIVGFDLKNLEECGAAHFHRFDDETLNGKMIWPTNYVKLASATMFTIFFGGNHFAPNIKYQGKTAQDFLMERYVACYQHLASRLKDCKAVIGIEAMNEPHPGFIGMHDLGILDEKKDLRFANSPLPLQSFALGMGETVEVDYYIRSWPFPTRRYGSRVLNEKKVRAWLPERECIWKEHGVWEFGEDGQPRLLKNHYFSALPDGKKVDFRQDFYLPFLKRFALAIRDVNPDLIFFFEPVPNEDPPKLDLNMDWHDNSVYAPHWYDLDSVFHKKFTGLMTHDVQALSKGTKNVLQASYFGINGAKRNYSSQVANVVRNGLLLCGKKPCLIGECGIPMDINEKKAFESGDYRHHNMFLDAVICAMEANLVHFTLWNYNPHNDNSFGDFWNGEDFSIFSALPKAAGEELLPRKLSVAVSSENADTSPKSPNSSQKAHLNSLESAFDLIDSFFEEPNAHHRGGRALDAVIRPYAAKTAGKPIFSGFDVNRTLFELVFVTPIDTCNLQNLEIDLCWTSEIYVPQFHFGDHSEPDVVVSDGKWNFDPVRQTIYWKINPLDKCIDLTSREYPNWVLCPKSAASKSLRQDMNFHTIQICKSKTLSANESGRNSNTSLDNADYCNIS